MKHLKTLSIAAVFGFLSQTANASCAFENDIPVSLLSPGFAAWKAKADAMGECGNFTPVLDQEYETKIAAALDAQPSLYQIAGLTVSTFDTLSNRNLLRPLDDYIAKYAPNLPDRRKVKVDGKVYAIASMMNVQHLMYRSDVLADLGIEVPQTYEEVLAAAETIQASGKVEYALGGTFKGGWNLGEEFVNMHLGFGGQLVDEEGNPTINNDAGLATLEMLKRLTEYMDPEFLASDSTYVQQQFQQGKIAIANLWASRASAMFDENESTVADSIVMAAAPSAVDGGTPATTLWWGGFGIAKNTDDASAEAAFRVAMEGSDAGMVTTPGNNDLNIWLIEGFQPNATSIGAIETIEKGTVPLYPASPAVSLMHSALGRGVSDFLIGEKSAAETLQAISEDYITSAQEAGLLK